MVIDGCSKIVGQASVMDLIKEKIHEEESILQGKMHYTLQ